jgi:hypothetical protein
LTLRAVLEKAIVSPELLSRTSPVYSRSDLGADIEKALEPLEQSDAAALIGHPTGALGEPELDDAIRFALKMVEDRLGAKKITGKAHVLEAMKISLLERHSKQGEPR